MNNTVLDVQQALHVSAPAGCKCADCTLALVPCPACYTAWYKKQFPALKFVDYLPIWKRNATAVERLTELAQIAGKHPEWFDKWVIVYCEDNVERFKTRYMQGETTRTSDCLAVLTAGTLTIFEETYRAPA